jgi:very-short-patch-repair endonuclease
MTRAQYLRKVSTRWERVLWRHLRNRALSGLKFRRQHPLDPYVLDFYCPEARLAIELDGGGHNYPGRQADDQRRSEFLMRQKIMVLRFWNRQVREELENVLGAIFLALEERLAANPSPPSSPFAQRERKQTRRAAFSKPRMATSLDVARKALARR